MGRSGGAGTALKERNKEAVRQKKKTAGKDSEEKGKPDFLEKAGRAGARQRPAANRVKRENGAKI